MNFVSDWSWVRFRNELKKDVFDKPGDNLKVSVPAVLYVVQNNLLFLALSKLDAATYQVTYQLKILTTAFFSVSLLGKQLDRYKWVALILLTGGVALVQLPKDSGTSATASERDTSDQFLGLCAVLAACVSSGFAGVYFEKILKGTPVTLWMRNLQLGMFYARVYNRFVLILIKLCFSLLQHFRRTIYDLAL